MFNRRLNVERFTQPALPPQGASSDVLLFLSQAPGQVGPPLALQGSAGPLPAPLCAGTMAHTGLRSRGGAAW